MPAALLAMKSRRDPLLRSLNQTTFSKFTTLTAAIEPQLPAIFH
jgi:hypothetical protein